MKNGHTKHDFYTGSASGLRKYHGSGHGIRQMCRDFDKAFDEVFSAKRPWLKRPAMGLVPAFRAKPQTSPTELAKAYLALPKPNPEPVS